MTQYWEMSYAERLKASREFTAAANEVVDEIPPEVAEHMTSLYASTEALMGLLHTDTQRHRRAHTAGSESANRLLAAAMGCVPSCPHLDGSRPVLALLAPRLVACRECIATGDIIPADVPDNGCCDICGEPSRQFTEFSCMIGGTIIVGDAGACCVSYVKAVDGGYRDGMRRTRSLDGIGEVGNVGSS